MTLYNVFAMFALAAHVNRGAATLSNSRSVSEASQGEDAPVVEVSLDAPAVPYPEISDLISSLDEDRRISEASGMRDVRSNFSRALESAQHLIRGAMGDLAQRLANVSGHQALVPRASTAAQSKNFTSFLSRRIGRAADAAPSVKLNVAPQRPTDAAILRAISDIEQRRSAGEKRRMEQAASDMAGITQIVLDALRAEMGADGSGAPAGGSRRGASSDGAAEFVEFARQGDGPQGGVRTVPSAVPFPTMASLVQSMEERRDAAEQLESAESIRMAAALAKAEVGMVREAVANAR